MQLSIKQTARILRLSERHVQERIEKGEIPSQCVNDRHFLNRDELIEWATARGLPVELPAAGAALFALAAALALAGARRRGR